MWHFEKVHVSLGLNVALVTTCYHSPKVEGDVIPAYMDDVFSDLPGGGDN